MLLDKYLISYERLSKDDPDSDESGSIMYQRMIISDFVRKDAELSAFEMKDFSDDGYSGTNLDRPGMQEILRLVKENKVYCVVVKDLTRFSRDFIDIQRYLERIFPALDVRFISIGDDFDSNDYIGKPLEMRMKFKSILADYYCKDTSDKIIQQLTAKKSQGKFIAGSTPFGYSKSKENKHKLVIEPREAEVVRRIFDMAISGMNINKIAKKLNEDCVPTPREFEKMKRCLNREPVGGKAFWYGRSVHSILTNEAYIGTMTYNKYRQRAVGGKKKELLPSSEWERIYNNHEAIICESDFYKVQERYSNNAKMQSRGKRSKNKEKYPLLGMLYCGACQRALAMVNIAEHNSPVFCNTRNYTDEYDCFREDFTMEEIEEVVLYQIKKHIKEVLSVDLLTGQEMMEITDRISSCSDDIAKAKADLDACDDELQELLVLKHRDKITMVEFMEQKTLLEVNRKSLLESIHETEKEILELRRSLNQAQKKERDIATYGNLDKITVELVEGLIEKIYMYPGMKMSIVWKNN
ncbi:MAG: recombinase family protein [Clostridia bacterium]|nr:recombinase family protein [Clostridia bacterium]